MVPALHHVVTGSGPRVVLVHGFTQTHACWGSLPEELARDHEVMALDAPGHGGSGAIEADLEAATTIIGETGGSGAYVGYSMGGRMVLHLALGRPDLVERLVLVGTTPGIVDEDERNRRRAHDEQLAHEVLEMGVEAFLGRWMNQPLFDSLPYDEACMRARRRNTAAGLASSLVNCGTGAQEPLWSRLAELTVPVLLVTGSRDAKFTAIAEKMRQAIGSNAEHVVFKGSGHAAHREQPERFSSLVRDFLREVP